MSRAGWMVATFNLECGPFLQVSCAGPVFSPEIAKRP